VWKESLFDYDENYDGLTMIEKELDQMFEEMQQDLDEYQME